jgi:hypothetical protein
MDFVIVALALVGGVGAESSLTAGTALVVNSGRSPSVTLASLGATTAIVCYQDQGNNHYGTCNHLTASGTSLIAAADFDVNTASTSGVALASLSSSAAILCYRNSGNSGYGTCNHLAASGTTLSKGAALVVNSASTSGFESASLSSSATINCYIKADVTGTCNIVAASGTTLSAGAALVVNNADTSFAALVTLSASAAVYCYTDGDGQGHLNHGTCKLLAASGTTLTAGAALVVNSADTQYLALASLDATTSVVCYTDHGNSAHGTCKVLTASGTSLTAGAALVVNSATTYSFNLVSLDATTAIVCYEDRPGSNKYGTCNILTASGTTLSAGAALVVNSGETNSFRLAALGASAAVVCYTNSISSLHVYCSLLAVPPNPPPPPHTPPPGAPPLYSPSPLSPPPPELPPPAPGVPTFKITTSFTLGGDLADYGDAGQASIKTMLAKVTGVSSNAIRLSLASGSVVVTAEVFVESLDAAEAGANALATGIMASSSSLETALTSQFESDGVSTTTLSVEGVTMAPAASAASTEAGGGCGVGCSVGIVFGIGPLVVVVGFYLRYRRNRGRAPVVAPQAKGGPSARPDPTAVQA